jgi:hypothetical protein
MVNSELRFSGIAAVLDLLLGQDVPFSFSVKHVKAAMDKN